MALRIPSSNAFSPASVNACPCAFPETRSTLGSPRTAGLLALVFTIFLWGYFYKLSLYEPHRDAASRLSAARFWVDSRGERIVGHALRKIASPDTDAGFAVPLFNEAPIEIGRLRSVPAPLCSPAPLAALVRPRSPPTDPPCLG